MFRESRGLLRVGQSRLPLAWHAPARVAGWFSIPDSLQAGHGYRPDAPSAEGRGAASGGHGSDGVGVL